MKWRTLLSFRTKITIFLFLIVMGLLGAGLFFDFDPFDFGSYISARFGSTLGITVGVAPNEVNMLVEQLQDKEKRLSEKEKTLQETELHLFQREAGQANALIYLVLIGGCLFGLILVNFYLDFKRAKKGFSGYS